MNMNSYRGKIYKSKFTYNIISQFRKYSRNPTPSGNISKYGTSNLEIIKEGRPFLIKKLKISKPRDNSSTRRLKPLIPTLKIIEFKETNRNIVHTSYKNISRNFCIRSLSNKKRSSEDQDEVPLLKTFQEVFKNYKGPNLDIYNVKDSPFDNFATEPIETKTFESLYKNDIDLFRPQTSDNSIVQTKLKLIKQQRPPKLTFMVFY